MSKKLKCFNPTCKCGNIELERVLKVRCKNCHCSIIYDIENVKLHCPTIESADRALKGLLNLYQQNT